MSVVEAWTPASGAQISGTGYEPTGSVEAGEEAIPVAHSGARRCAVLDEESGAEGGRWIARGDPMEAALDVIRLKARDRCGGGRGKRASDEALPFDPRRRGMSVVVGDRLFVKGAPDSVCPRCLQTRALRRRSRR